MLVDPIAALGAVGTALKIVDSITGQWDRVFRKKAQPPENIQHRVTTERESNDSIAVREDGKKVFAITAADIAKLDPNSVRLIEALEKSMQQNYDLWCAVYPTRGESADPVVNAKVEQRLKKIAQDMCADLGRIFRYLDKIGRRLEDHYEHAQFICADLGAK